MCLDTTLENRETRILLVVVLTDVTRLNFFEVARAAFFSKY